MALPKAAAETERLLALRAIVEATGDEIFHWPNPTTEDYAAFGRFMWLFTGIDFVLRMTAEVMDEKGMLEAPYSGKVRKLSIVKTTKAITSWPNWPDPNRRGFARIEELRRFRNLIAHFIVKRFISDDAFVFMTKSAPDFEQVYGELPEPHRMLYGIVEAPHLLGVIPEIKGLMDWVSKLPHDLSKLAD
jgi:hypothetical protein